METLQGKLGFCFAGVGNKSLGAIDETTEGEHLEKMSKKTYGLLPGMFGIHYSSSFGTYRLFVL